MILGVVLGRIAEQWLSRSLARSDDLSYFVTSPWSLFFLLLAAFSIFFPKYQAERGKRTWTLLYPAVFMISLSLPAFMMGGPVRIGLGILLIAVGIRSLVKHHVNGWKVDPTVSHAPQLREG
jgi:putative tricarboxylic transport membrane protein